MNHDIVKCKNCGHTVYNNINDTLQCEKCFHDVE